MQLCMAEPDRSFLRHIIFVCDCGRTTDQLVADQDPEVSIDEEILFN